jgi:hypothetical protein
MFFKELFMYVQILKTYETDEEKKNSHFHTKTNLILYFVLPVMFLDRSTGKHIYYLKFNLNLLNLFFSTHKIQEIYIRFNILCIISNFNELSKNYLKFVPIRKPS